MIRASTVAGLLDLVPVADEVEADHLTRMRGLLTGGDETGSRHHYTPGHVTASAFVVHPGRHSVLLIHHAKLGLWLQPGGHLEPTDHTHEDAARREVGEETGVFALESWGPLDVDIHTFPARHGTPEHLHFDLRWAFLSADERVEVGDGVAGVRWVEFDEALAMERSIARPVGKLVGRRW